MRDADVARGNVECSTPRQGIVGSPEGENTGTGPIGVKSPVTDTER
jgi:hypothetical protein